MIPLRLYLLAAAAIVALSLAGRAGWMIRDSSAQRQENERIATQRHVEQANRVLAHQASTDFQLAEGAARRRFQETDHEFNQALVAPTSPDCPALGDLPVPAAVLHGLRDAWSVDADDGAATGGPRDSVRDSGLSPIRRDRDGG